MKYWLVEFPTFRYNEDAKVEARKAGVRILDARFANSVKKDQIEPAKDCPKLTLKAEFQPKKAETKAS